MCIRDRSTLDTTQTTVADGEAALTGTLSFTPGADAEGAQVRCV